MENIDPLFDPALCQATQEFYETRERYRQILDYRRLSDCVAPVRNLFYGDSITELWPLAEFFPNHSIVNRGIGGDNVHGLYLRLQPDVFALRPQRVFLLIGINGIEQEQELSIARVRAVTGLIRAAGIQVWLGSILPLRDPDNWDRFQYMDKIRAINAAQQAWCEAGNAEGFLDYHSLLIDSDGQLAAEYATPDGTHITFAAYCRMAELVEPFLV